MFKNRKLEVRLVKDDARNEAIAPEDVKPALDAYDYALITEEAVVRLGKKLLIAGAIALVSTAVVVVLTNAADSVLQNAIND
jgi:hypothetical protein